VATDNPQCRHCVKSEKKKTIRRLHRGRKVSRTKYLARQHGRGERMLWSGSCRPRVVGTDLSYGGRHMIYLSVGRRIPTGRL
jgi:hypothetical protein